MGNVNDWADLCPQTVCWESLTGRDQYGAPTFAPAVTFRGRRTAKVMRKAVSGAGGPQGQGPDVVSGTQIWILGTPAVKYEDRVYIQGDTAPFPPIVSIQTTPDEDGDLFCKVILGSANG